MPTEGTQAGGLCPGAPVSPAPFCRSTVTSNRALSASRLSTFIHLANRYRGAVTARTFAKELKVALKAYDHHVVALGKSNEDFKAALNSLMAKAIQAYENRGEGMRHGIALDKEVTIILSQGDTKRPLCGIYFNLHSPYRKKIPPKTVKRFGETKSGEGK